MDTKQQILDYLLHEGGIDPDSSMFEKNTTMSIADYLHISRTLASQYVNDLHKKGNIIKIISRPVLYVSQEKLERELNFHVQQYEFADIDEYREWYVKAFENDGIVGSNGSLLYALIQIQTGLLFADHGLPILLFGHAGSGRKFLIHNVLSSNIRRNRLSASWKLISMYVNDYKDVKDVLADIKKHLKSSTPILLYLHNVSSLYAAESITMITYLMKLKNKKIPFNFIIELNETEMNAANSKLVESMPIIAKIPDLKERPLYERRLIIIRLLEKEATTLEKDLKLEAFVFDVLEQLSIEISISALHRIIKQTIASAYHMYSSCKSVIMRTSNLPNEVSYQVHDGIGFDKQRMEVIDLNCMKSCDNDHTIAAFCKNFMKQFEVECIRQDNSIASFCENQFYLIRSYINEQIDSYYYKEMKQTVSMQIIMDVIRLFEDSLHIYMPAGFAYFIRQFFDLAYLQDEFKKLEMLNRDTYVPMLMSFLEAQYTSSYTYAHRFMNQLNLKGSITSSSLLIMMLTICIEFFNQGKQLKTIGALIISHGASTATSIADTANFLLGNKIFTAMDMPMSMNIKDMAIKLNDYLTFNDLYDYVVILVDMGSLTEIMNDIDHKHNFTYGIINNVSTAVALEVGSRIKQGQDFFEIIKSTVENMHNEYTIIQPEHKKKAIVITSELGRKTASKIASLFKNSLPQQHPFTILEYDYEQLKEKKMDSLIFKEYDVKLLIRPESMNIDHIICLSLEDVIYMRDLDTLNIALNQYFSEEQTAVFHMNLIKNFSLENVVENLTILNARNLMDLVVDSVEKLIQSLKKSIDARTRIGVYIHICFLVERLVTKNEIQTDQEVTKAFLENNNHFITIVETSFRNMLESYSVRLPVSEIKYLYDYIYNQEEKKYG